MCGWHLLSLGALATRGEVGRRARGGGTQSLGSDREAGGRWDAEPRVRQGGRGAVGRGASGQTGRPNQDSGGMTVLEAAG